MKEEDRAGSLLRRAENFSASERNETKASGSIRTGKAGLILPPQSISRLEACQQAEVERMSGLM